MAYKLLKWESGTLLQTVGSTNEWLKSPERIPGSWVVSEEQTKGKGRGNHSWQSLGEEKFFFSGKIELPETHGSLTLFSLFASSAVLRSIFFVFPDLYNIIQIKWPNDIYKKEKKVGGILIESIFQNGKMEIIIGIGLNFHGQAIPKDLQDKADFLLDRSLFEGERERFLQALVQSINEIVLKTLDPNQIFKELEWIESHSLFKDKVLEWEAEGLTQTASFLGYDENGFMVLRNAQGQKLELIDTPNQLRII